MSFCSASEASKLQLEAKNEQLSAELENLWDQLQDVQEQLGSATPHLNLSYDNDAFRGSEELPVAFTVFCAEAIGHAVTVAQSALHAVTIAQLAFQIDVVQPIGYQSAIVLDFLQTDLLTCLVAFRLNCIPLLVTCLMFLLLQVVFAIVILKLTNCLQAMAAARDTHSLARELTLSPSEAFWPAHLRLSHNLKVIRDLPRNSPLVA